MKATRAASLNSPRDKAYVDSAFHNKAFFPRSFVRYSLGLHQRVCKPLSIRVNAKRASHNGSSSLSRSRAQADKIDDVIRYRYFGELFTGGDYTLAHKILDPSIVHKDMVRDETWAGVDAVVEYMRHVKQAYPAFIVRATEIAIAEDASIFAAFEGHASEGMPMFSGVDRFFLTADGKIKEVNVYRSNWKGPQGHEQRKIMHQNK